MMVRNRNVSHRMSSSHSGSKCKKIIGALKFIAGGSSFKVKKRLAEAVIMARITYGIQLWGAVSAKSVIKRIAFRFIIRQFLYLGFLMFSFRIAIQHYV